MSDQGVEDELCLRIKTLCFQVDICETETTGGSEDFPRRAGHPRLYWVWLIYVFTSESGLASFCRTGAHALCIIILDEWTIGREGAIFTARVSPVNSIALECLHNSLLLSVN